ncbi:MAG: cytochrome-c peroxidase [Deltaproteobacteria bacterium]|jgi:cytochrome c peroxidase
MAHATPTSSALARASLALASLLVCGCGATPSPGDAGQAHVDTAPDDSPHDSGMDAGCTGRPGELAGERSIATGALPPLAWAGLLGEVSLVDHHAPCAPGGELIVLRELALWSGPARWHAAHSGELASMDGVVVIDLWSSDEDAMPMRIERLPDVRAVYDVEPDAIASDPEEQLAVLGIGGTLLPVVLVLDARTLTAERVLLDPRAGEVEHAVRAVQAELRGQEPPRAPDPVLVDGRFTPDRWALIEEMALPHVPPASPSNAVADDPRAAALGARLFADAALSPAGVACTRCHDPGRAFTDARPLGRGVADVTRHTPTVIGASGLRWQFWDGRADTLWAQALGPLENPREMGSSRLFVAHRVAGAYATEYEALFGALPPLDDATRFPAEGLPGSAAYEAMSEADREATARVFANVGKAIEAYERTVRPEAGRFEAYVAGDLEALRVEERDGLRAFVAVGCAQCHWGPLLSNGAFFAIDMPGVGEGAAGDPGRIAAMEALASSPFRAQGAFSDDRSVRDPLEGVLAFPERMRGAFRTPTLRAIARTAPYGHAGTFATLREVVEHYARIRRPRMRDPRVVGELDPHVVGFEDSRVAGIVRFLEAL